MTQVQLFNIVREMGLTISKDDSGDYRINFKGGKEATAYYTDCRVDAIITAAHMAGWNYEPTAHTITVSNGDRQFRVAMPVCC